MQKFSFFTYCPWCCSSWFSKIIFTNFQINSLWWVSIKNELLWLLWFVFYLLRKDLLFFTSFLLTVCLCNDRLLHWNGSASCNVVLTQALFCFNHRKRECTENETSNPYGCNYRTHHIPMTPWVESMAAYCVDSNK